MSKPKHTPGPWGSELGNRWVFASKLRNETKQSKANGAFAVCGCELLARKGATAKEVRALREETEANALLISAAPELLDAAEMALEMALGGPRFPHNLAMIRAAISKARGEES